MNVDPTGLPGGAIDSVRCRECRAGVGQSPLLTGTE